MTFQERLNYRDRNQISGGLEVRENTVFSKNFSWLHFANPHPHTPASTFPTMDLVSM